MSLATALAWVTVAHATSLDGALWSCDIFITQQLHNQWQHNTFISASRGSTYLKLCSTAAERTWVKSDSIIYHMTNSQIKSLYNWYFLILSLKNELRKRTFVSIQIFHFWVNYPFNVLCTYRRRRQITKVAETFIKTKSNYNNTETELKKENWFIRDAF